MKTSRILLGWIKVLLIFVVLVGCEEDEPQLPTFDRDLFLISQADHEIIPRVDAYADAVEECRLSIIALTSQPSSERVIEARNKFANAYKAWQSVNFLNFGPGAKSGLKLSLAEELGLFPLDVLRIEQRIEEKSTIVDDHRRNTRGLLAIDYILHRAKDASQLAESIDRATADYLLAVTNKVGTQSDDFARAWRSYRDEFVSNNGTDVKSSTTQYYNDWLRSYELLKNLKFTEPLGLKAGQRAPEPDLVECLNSGNSLIYAKEHFQSLVEVFRSSSQDTVSWDKYLQSIEGGAALVNRINSQIAKIEVAFEEVPSNKTLKELVEEEDPKVLSLHEELQVLVPMIKSEMSSLLGIAITFSTTDGD